MSDTNTIKTDPEGTSVDLAPNQPADVPHPCISCGGAGVLRLLIVPDMFFSDSLISTFTCSECPFRNKQIDEMHLSEKGVRIKCRLNKPEDLRRYLVVPSGARVSIDAGERGVSSQQPEDTIVTVESFIRNIFEKLISMGSMPEDKITEEELAGLEEYADIAAFLQKSMDDLDVTLSIEDPKGAARVMPVGRNMQTTTKGLPLEYFRDGVVEIEEYEVSRSAPEDAGSRSSPEDPEQPETRTE
ncbi:zinc finger protein [Nematocida major]|uniref:zinc finger protein n=1 Tax=Nematocida major TaxID=1912982 RepID=UPI0020078C7F|nr:zinc finger protein [Nematocida major]KAH9386596.1 zinc finger protein [Nematocida major]